MARDIAAVLGLKRKAQGYLEGPGYQVTWAYGHLVGLAEPHEINPAWKNWRAEDLPILPATWPLEIMPNTAEQFAVVKQLLNAPSTTSVICATDAGREGELIFRYIYEKSACTKPVQRLWISSLTPAAIQEGLQKLRPAQEFDGLADSARARSRADWLVGMNLSRAYSLQSGENFSIGRVQTPTLAMIVERDLAILNFVPEDYVVIQAQFCQGDSMAYSAELVRSSDSPNPKAAKPAALVAQALRFAPGDARIPLICSRLPGAHHEVLSLKEKPGRLAPPQFYDLTELQRHANRCFGFSAQKTLDLAQELYEKHKLITYPRTDSRYIPEDLCAGLSSLLPRLKERYRDLLKGCRLADSLGSRYVDKTRVTDHHAILPTDKTPSKTGLAAEHAQLYDLICRRLLMAYMDDSTAMNTEAEIRSESMDTGQAIQDYFFARGRRVLNLGWKKLDFGKDKTEARDKDLPSAMCQGALQTLNKVEADSRRTLPPPALSDASLLTAMEHAGSKVTDKQLAAAMREHGLGTPATRSNMIETLIKRLYIKRDQRSLRATEKGFRLIEHVAEAVKSPRLTGAWELRLSQIRKGQGSLAEFTADIKDFVSQMTVEALQSRALVRRAGASLAVRQDRDVPLAKVRSTGASPKNSSRQVEGAVSAPPIRQGAIAQSTSLASVPAVSRSRPLVSSDETLQSLLQKHFGFSSFRPHQESTCRDLVQQHDVLLVMPTGAGKSLCYQLPGLALGGATLVISPLIALMDDQVIKLKAMGLSADAIHSGKSRAESQEICRQYANHQLDFLFVAPERLGVTGFVPFLVQHKPSLIAIDEAHCISNWGHDFRYDYRRLTERLAPLRPAVIIAMTATATLRVQEDIVDQLDLQKLIRHVHGFRRTNIAIENIEMRKSERAEAIIEVLNSAQSLPAIVYAPTRRDAEQTAQLLQRSFRVAAYHAGLDGDTRSRVQAGFQADKLEVIVATVAFGMGIDKPNVRTVIHMAAPASIEAYYQEIGRAGRDGQASRAVLFYSYADLKTHEYFHKLNYPNLEELQSVLALVPSTGIARVQINSPLEDINRHLERLIMIGAVLENAEGFLCATGQRDWESRYKEQKQHRHDQLMEMNRYVQGRDGCRMLRLMEHFGDKDAAGPSCGICDICAPQRSQSKSLRAWSQKETDLAKAIFAQLAQHAQPLALGKLYRECAEPLGLMRHDFDAVMDALIQRRFLKAKQESFMKDGEAIHYRTVSMAGDVLNIEWDALQIVSHKPRAKTLSKSTKATRQGASSARKRPSKAPLQSDDPKLLEALRTWRQSEAKKLRIPAYRILSDRSLVALVNERPSDSTSLLAVYGIGASKVEQFGGKILSLLSDS